MSSRSNLEVLAYVAAVLDITFIPDTVEITAHDNKLVIKRYMFGGRTLAIWDVEVPVALTIPRGLF